MLSFFGFASPFIGDPQGSVRRFSLLGGFPLQLLPSLRFVLMYIVYAVVFSRGEIKTRKKYYGSRGGRIVCVFRGAIEIS